MPARAFFSEKFWKGEVIVFQESDGYNTKKWEIKKKLEEQHHLEDEDEWKFFLGNDLCWQLVSLSVSIPVIPVKLHT
jgi:hypothetical protein